MIVIRSETRCDFCGCMAPQYSPGRQQPPGWYRIAAPVSYRTLYESDGTWNDEHLDACHSCARALVGAFDTVAHRPSEAYAAGLDEPRRELVPIP